MLARRFCVFNAGLKVDAVQEILIVIMTSYDENVRSCKKTHSSSSRIFFWRSLCPFLALRLTTVSLDTSNDTSDFIPVRASSLSRQFV